MAQTESILFAAASALGLVYVGLALLSMRHVPTEKKPLLSSRLPIFFFWWPFYGDLYGSSVGRLRLVGVLVFLGMLAMYGFSFMEAHAKALP